MSLLHQYLLLVLVLSFARLLQQVQLLPKLAQQLTWSMLMRVPASQQPHWSIIWGRQPGLAAFLRQPLWLQLLEQEASTLF